MIFRVSDGVSGDDTVVTVIGKLLLRFSANLSTSVAENMFLSFSALSAELQQSLR